MDSGASRSTGNPPNPTLLRELGRDAREALGSGGEAAWFAESRVDARVEAAGSGPPTIVTTFVGGVAVSRDDGTSRHRAFDADLARVDGTITRERCVGHAEALATVVASSSAGRGLGGTVAVTARWNGFDQAVEGFHPGGGDFGDRRGGRRLRIAASVTRRGAQGRAVRDWIDPGGSSSALEPAVAERFVRRTVEAAVHRCAARPCPRGATTAVFAPGTGGILVHELVGHALEADAPSWLARGDARFRSREVRVLDDPRRGRASWRVDDEGTPASPVALVTGGRVRGRIVDRRSAGAMPCCGHGRRATWRDPVLPRMGCTFLAPGRLAAEEVVRDVGEGLYVERMDAASVDPLRGRATFLVTEASRIEGGRIARPVAPLLMTIEGRDLLSGLDRIADDLCFDRCVGACLKAGQPLSVSVGAPTFCIGLARVVT